VECETKKNRTTEAKNVLGESFGLLSFKNNNPKKDTKNKLQKKTTTYPERCEGEGNSFVHSGVMSNNL